ncbi:MAG: arylamine N-acetyltransferase [Clostridia bacterium]|nr:arylamine N-acetyltransferase [Clostridia bacterium]
MNTTAYLRRIGLDACDVAHTYAFLEKLQKHHITSVPYENLDILNGIPLSLDADALYDKIVTRHRGGYCFELGGALSALLGALGFSVTNYMARFLKNETSIPVRRHRVVVVACEGERYVCEVGIGQYAPRVPLLLREGLEQFDGYTSYKFEKEDFLGWVLYEKNGAEWRRYYAFTEEEQLDIDYIQPSFYCEKHPDSPFHQSVMVAIKTPTGRRAINGRDYKEFEGDVLTHIEENISDARLYELLQTVFGIEWKWREQI